MHDGDQRKIPGIVGDKDASFEQACMLKKAQAIEFDKRDDKGANTVHKSQIPCESQWQKSNNKDRPEPG